MSKREEIKEEVKEIVANSVSSFNTFNYDKSLEEATDKILALAPFAKLEKLREYCNKYSGKANEPSDIYNEGKQIGKREVADNILSILSENEKPFDMREWLVGKGFESDDHETEYKKVNVEIQFCDDDKIIIYYDEHDKTQSGKNFTMRHTLYFGSIPISLYFWEMLLKSLGPVL